MRDVEKMEGIMEGVDKVIDHLIGLAEKDGYTVPCAGCSKPACCSLLVQVFPSEAWYISEEIDKLPRKVRRQIDRKLAKWLQWHRKQGDWKYEEPAYFEQQKACPLLIDGKCAVYDRRPVNCRCYQPLDTAPEWCNSTEYTTKPKIDMDPARDVAMAGIMEDGVEYYCTLQLALCAVRSIGRVTPDEMAECFIKTTEAGLPL
tara:strand:- start:912 stop:1517 length:606 start_codon:yes stop_codon:yes gene_type:complete